MLTEGTSKQIAWGMKLRTALLVKWKMSDPESFNEIETSLVGIKSATWWIANKDKGIDGISQVLGKKKSVGKSICPPTVAISSCLSEAKKSYEACADGIHRYVGELKDMVTGEVVVDTACPF